MFFPGLEEKNGKKQKLFKRVNNTVQNYQANMRRLHRDLFLVPLTTFSFLTSFSQYVINGSCTQNNCHCFTLTQPINTQAGSFWGANQIDLNTPFDFEFSVYLGCTDANGADGIVFVLRPNGTNNIGITGGSLGYSGITPSLGVEIDTWQNNGVGYNDPVYDHIAIMKNGSNDHTSSNALSSYAPASLNNTNIEDCQWHEFRVSWDPSTFLMSVYFDGSLRTQYTGDIVSTIFSGNSMVYWGFVGSTGGASNLQQVCTVLATNFGMNIINNETCEGNAVQFTDSSICFSNIQTSYWNFGDGTTSPFLNPAPHYYYTPGTYVIKHTIAGIDGCVSDTVYKTITVGAKPVADFTVTDVCFKNIPTVVDQSTCSFGTITQWTWTLDGNFISNAQQPGLPFLFPGIHQLQLVVTTEYGCVSFPVIKDFTVKPIPEPAFAVISMGCTNQLYPYIGNHGDTLTTVAQWNWSFTDGFASNLQNVIHSFANAGNYTVQFFILATNGCSSDTLEFSFPIISTPIAAFTIGDTCEGKPSILLNQSTTFGTTMQWNWILDGLPYSTQQTPMITGLTAGVHQLQLIALGYTETNGCPDTTMHSFTIKPAPVLTASGSDACLKQPVQFTASQTDNSTTIQQWNWIFGDGGVSTSQNPMHNYNAGGNYNVSVTATATNGCVSASVPVPIKINQLNVNAGSDMVVLMNAPFTLNGSTSSATNGSLTYTWTPPTGLNNPGILNPVSTLSDNIVYTLTVTSAEGCVATDQVSIEVFKGSGIYVPSGFTPNHDGKNDVLRPKYIGIKQLNYFTIYNRWGQLVFTTKDMTKGWDATINGKDQNSGVFVWIISAVDLDGKKYELKGTTAIIR